MTDPVPAAALPDPPARTKRVYARGLVDAGISAVPFVGGPAEILLGMVLRPAYEKRLDAWTEQLAATVQDIERRLGGANIADLSDHDPFVDAVTHATRIALGTAIEEKLAMLQAALTTVAVQPISDDFITHRFLDFVDELSVEHFEVLRYAISPADWPRKLDVPEASTPLAALEGAFATMESETVALLLFDLRHRGLIEVDRLDRTSLGKDALSPFATNLGRQLVEFVRWF